MNKAMEIFSYIEEKDTFEIFYKKDLAKRLLLNRSLSLEIELNMLSKLKKECGSEFTKQLERMFKDIETSKDMNQDFKTFRNFKNLNFDIYVNVITSGFWPTYNIEPIILPKNVNNII
jgi:cullin-4